MCDGLNEDLNRCCICKLMILYDSLCTSVSSRTEGKLTWVRERRRDVAISVNVSHLVHYWQKEEKNIRGLRFFLVLWFFVLFILFFWSSLYREKCDYFIILLYIIFFWLENRKKKSFIYHFPFLTRNYNTTIKENMSKIFLATSFIN